MARIVTKNGVSVSTAVPKNKTTTKSGVTGVSVGEIQGSKKAPVVTTPAAPTKPVNTKPVYRSVNGKVVDVNKPKIPTKVDPTSTKGQVTYVQDESINTNGGLMDQKGNYNMDYIPQTLEELTNIPDPNTRNYLMANYYKSKGLDFNTEGLAKNYDEAAQLFIEGQKEEMSALDKEIAYAKKTASDRLKASTGAVKNQFAQSREGQVSAGNTAVAQETNVAMTEEVGRQFDQMSQQKRQLEKLQQQQQTEYSEGRAAQIAQLQQNVADAEANLAETQSKQAAESLALIKELNSAGALAGLDEIGIANLQAALGGLPEGVVNMFANAATQKNLSEGSKAKWEKMNTALNTFKGLAAEGIQITPEMMLETAQQTGMPLEALMAFNQRAIAIMQDKKLDQAQQMVELQKVGIELDREARGIVTEDAKNVDMLTRMIQNGTDPEIIDAFKQATGLVGSNDPAKQLDMAYKQAQIAYTKSQTAENYVAMKKAEREYLDMLPGGGGGVSGGYYLPNKSLDGITSEFKDGKLQINAPKPYQCGAFVNRVWGLAAGGTEGMGSSIGEKTKLCQKTGFLKEQLTTDNFASKIKPGMAFVTKIGSTGHTGIVTAVYPDGTYDTMEANIGDGNPLKDDPARPNHRSIKDMDLVGFASPPSGKASLVETRTSGEQSYEDFVEGKIAGGMSRKDAVALANKREEKKLESEETESKYGNYTKDEQQIIKDLYGQYDDLSKEIRALDQGNAFLSSYSVENAKSPDDIALIYAFNKVMDPRSVVREGEFTIASSVGGVLDQMGANIKNIEGGGRLTSEQRQQIVDTMKRTYQSKRAEYDPILENAIQAGAKRGIDDPTVYLDYVPGQDSIEANQKPDPWEAIRSGVSALMGNNFNQPAEVENPFDTIDITSDEDILNDFNTP